MEALSYDPDRLKFAVSKRRAELYALGWQPNAIVLHPNSAKEIKELMEEDPAGARSSDRLLGLIIMQSTEIHEYTFKLAEIRILWKK